MYENFGNLQSTILQKRKGTLQPDSAAVSNSKDSSIPSLVLFNKFRSMGKEKEVRPEAFIESEGFNI